MLKSIYVFMFGLLTSLLHSAGAPVYIVGEQEDNTSDATLWITDATGSLPKAVVLGNQIYDSTASSLTSINNKLFCLGQQNDGTDPKATLWITDTSGSAPQTVQLENDFDFDANGGRSITSVNGKIVCIGSNIANNEKAALLIFDTSNQNQSIIELGIPESFGVAIAHANNKIYCSGGQSDGQHAHATIWITDTSGQPLKSVRLDDSNVQSTTAALAATNNKIYCIGRVNFKPTLWITDTDGSNLSSISLENITNSNPTAITVTNNRLYVLSYKASSANTLTISILDTSGTLIKNVDLGGDVGSSIQSFGQQIFAVGYQGTAYDSKAALWVTDVLGSSISSYTLAPSSSSAVGIYMTQTFYQALQKFSPVHFQKGI